MTFQQAVWNWSRMVLCRVSRFSYSNYNEMSMSNCSCSEQPTCFALLCFAVLWIFGKCLLYIFQLDAQSISQKSDDFEVFDKISAKLRLSKIATQQNGGSVKKRFNKTTSQQNCDSAKLQLSKTATQQLMWLSKTAAQQNCGSIKFRVSKTAAQQNCGSAQFQLCLNFWSIQYRLNL